MHRPVGRVRTRHREAEANQRIYLSDYLMDLDRITVNAFLNGYWSRTPADLCQAFGSYICTSKDVRLGP